MPTTPVPTCGYAAEPFLEVEQPPGLRAPDYAGRLPPSNVAENIHHTHGSSSRTAPSDHSHSGSAWDEATTAPQETAVGGGSSGRTALRQSSGGDPASLQTIPGGLPSGRLPHGGVVHRKINVTMADKQEVLGLGSGSGSSTSATFASISRGAANPTYPPLRPAHHVDPSLRIDPIDASAALWQQQHCSTVMQQTTTNGSHIGSGAVVPPLVLTTSQQQTSEGEGDANVEGTAGKMECDAAQPPNQHSSTTATNYFGGAGAGTTVPSHPPRLRKWEVPSDLPAAAPKKSSSAVPSDPAAAAMDTATPASSDADGRPALALSVHALATYRFINVLYYTARRREVQGSRYNNGYDTKDGHYLFLPGEVIFDRYETLEVLGKGSFGTVVRCYDQLRRMPVALKITRRGHNFRCQASQEMSILIRLNENPALRHLVVRLLKAFQWQNHLVLVFELLSFNLYQMIKCTNYTGVSLVLVRKFAYQLISTLLQLEQHKPHPVIHCDLKPENIVLRNQYCSGIRLIDFGSAIFDKKHFHWYVQTRFYRSPEVILCLRYTTAIDRWSLACVLAEFHTGVPLFNGRTEAEQLSKFEATLGPIPSELIAASPKVEKFFTANPDTGYVLKEREAEQRPLKAVLRSVADNSSRRSGDAASYDEPTLGHFIDFISRLLQYMPSKRMSCQDALKHPFLLPLHELNAQQQQQQMGGVGHADHGVVQHGTDQLMPPPPPSSSSSSCPVPFPVVKLDDRPPRVPQNCHFTDA